MKRARRDRKGVALGRAWRAHDDDAHADPDDIARFVIDALDDGARLRLERHVMSCPACAAALALEAAAELDLASLYAQQKRPMAPVLTLPVRNPAAALAATPDVAATTETRPSPSAARAGTVVSERARVSVATRWEFASNSLAAAVLTVLFVGYWSQYRAPGGAAADPLALAAGPAAVCLAAQIDDPGLCAPALSHGESPTLGDGAAAALGRFAESHASALATGSLAVVDRMCGPWSVGGGGACLAPPAGTCAVACSADEPPMSRAGQRWQ